MLSATPSRLVCRRGRWALELTRLVPVDNHVRMLSQTLYPRSFDQPDKLEAAASYIHQEFARSGAAVEDQVFSVEGARYRNVSVRFGPKDGPLLVIGAPRVRP